MAAKVHYLVVKKGLLVAGAVALGLFSCIDCGCGKDPASEDTIVVQHGTATESHGAASTQSTGNSATHSTSKAGSTPDSATAPGPSIRGTKPDNRSNNIKDQPPKPSWQPDSESPMDLAKSVDQKLAGLRNTQAKVDLRVQNKDGGGGGSKGDETIQDGKVFHLEYPILSDVKYQELTKATFIADGKAATVLGVGGPKMRQPVNSLKVSTKAPLAQWPAVFPQLVFTPICGGHPFEDLLSEAQKPNSGVKVTVEKASFGFRGKTFNQQRIRFDKTSKGGAVFGMIVTIDSTYDLPVTIDAKGGKSADSEFVVRWSSAWNFHPTLPFDPTLFSIPTPTPVAK